MPHATIQQDSIKQLSAQMRTSFDNNGPLRVAMDALIPDRLSAAAAAPTATADGDQRR